MIINPMTAYLINVADTLRVFFYVVGALCCVSSIIGIPIYKFDMEESIPPWMIKTLVAGVLILVVAAFLPSKETAIEMIACNLCTAENVEIVTKSIEEFVFEIGKALK